MAKNKQPDPPPQTEAERDAMIDSHYQDRIVGGEDEGAAWTKAFGGDSGGAADNSPLTPEEKAAVRDLMIHAAETGDSEGLERLKQLTGDPAALRKVMADFDPNK